MSRCLAFLTAIALALPAWGEPVVVIDPGHGGRDPGAQAVGLEEANLVLAIALRLAAALEDGGARAVLTRESDETVHLGDRITRAQSAGPDVFLSLHADALADGRASGLSVYRLSTEAASALDQRRIARHGGGELLSGVDLGDAGDDVAFALMDLVRRETGPDSRQLSEAIVSAVQEAGLPLHPKPERAAAFAILGAADTPSVLIELGYLSTEADRLRLTSVEGQAALAEALADGVFAWWAAREADG